MVVLTAETCWALNEYWINNKISGIKLVSLYSKIEEILIFAAHDITCFMKWKPHVFSEDSSGYWNMNSGLLRRGTMNQLVYGSSNSFGRMSIMPLEETNWEGGEGIIDHNNPITLHNNTRRSTDWFKCLSRWYADEFWCLSVCPSVGQLIAYRIKYSSWLLRTVETRLHYTSQQVLWGSVGMRVGGCEGWRVWESGGLRVW